MATYWLVLLLHSKEVLGLIPTGFASSPGSVHGVGGVWG